MPVYVAETTQDLYEQREALCDDLIDRGFQVLPGGELPRHLKMYTDAVKSYLERAVLSVHLVGREYGFIPEGEKEFSNVRLQHRLALERCAQDPRMAQIVWLAGGVSSDERQRAFIDYLQNDEKAHAHGELIEGDLESLKTELYQKLAKLKAAANAEKPEAQSTETDHPLVYIICDKADRASEQLKALRNYLFAQGCEPKLPIEGGADDELLKAHQQKLEEFDAFLIYYGTGSEGWLEAQLTDFRKYLKNRAKKVLAKVVYLVPPIMSAKDELVTHEAQVLRSGDTFSPETIEAFVAPLRKASGK
jgi:hypothetical protein